MNIQDTSYQTNSRRVEFSKGEVQEILLRHVRSISNNLPHGESRSCMYFKGYPHDDEGVVITLEYPPCS